MGNYQIDRIKSITLHCRDGNGEEFVMMCDVEPNSVSMSIAREKENLSPKFTITARLDTMAVIACENEMDDSSEELDIFLKQFLKE